MPDPVAASDDLTTLGQNNQTLIAAIAAQQTLQGQAQSIVAQLISANQAVLDAFTQQQTEQTQVVADTKSFLQANATLAQQLAAQLSTPLTPTPPVSPAPAPSPSPAPASPS